MQLTPFGRLEIKIDELPTITDDPRETGVDFEKVIAREEKRKPVDSAKGDTQGPPQGLPPQNLGQALAPANPTHPQPSPPPEGEPSSSPHPSETEGTETSGDTSGDTLSLGDRPARKGGGGPTQSPSPTRFRFSPGRTFTSKDKAPAFPFPGPTTKPVPASPGAEGEKGMKGIGRDNSVGLGKNAGKKSSEAKDLPKARESKASYRSGDPNRAQLAKANQDSIFRQVTMALTQEGGSMFLAIDPPSLGHIALELRLDGDKLRLKIRAEHMEVTDSLRKGMGQLKDLLLSQGMNVEEFDVRTGTQQEQARDGRDFEKSFEKNRGRKGDGMPPASSKETPLISPLGIRKGNGIDFIA